MRKFASGFGRRALWVVVVAAFAALATAAWGAGSNSSPVTTVSSVNAWDAAQAEVLSDQLVDVDEMQATLDRVVQCVREAGYEAELVGFIPGISWHLRTSGETTEEADRADSALADCRAVHADAVMDAYWSQNALTGADLEQFDELVRSCLEGAGVTARAGKSLAPAIDPRSAEQLTECQVEAMATVR